MNHPSPSDIKSLRLSLGLTQTKAGELVYRNCRAWQRWEAGDFLMDAAIWELFKIKSKL